MVDIVPPDRKYHKIGERTGAEREYGLTAKEKDETREKKQNVIEFTKELQIENNQIVKFHNCGCNQEKRTKVADPTSMTSNQSG